MAGNASATGQGPPIPPTEALHCVNPQCARREGMLRAEVDRLNVKIQELTVESQVKARDIRQLREEKTDLERQNNVLRARRSGQGKHTERTWPDELRGYLLNFHPNPKQYTRIYRLCCMEENMSSKTPVVHPDIKFVGPRRLAQHNPGPETDSSDVEGEEAPEVVLEDDSTQPVRDKKPFSFEKLPWELQAKILKLLLHKEGKIIHCISRLDPFVQPEEFPSEEDLAKNRSGLPHRFYWGEREMNLSEDGVKPEDVLAILTVSKRVYFIGAHIFYGLNTFAFSSLGELGRFCQGSGLARIARIQHVEVFLTGNQYLTAPLDTRQKRPFSRRSFPMTWLVDMYRLKTLVIHLNETGKEYIRRGYEAPAIKRFLAAKTAGQPNQRMTRSLRCLQGLDYIYQLRGLEWIRFYDFAKVLKTGRSVRKTVQDWSFVEDVTNTTTLPKAPVREEHSKLENLAPLLKDEGQKWTPSPDDWELVKSVFIDSNGRCSYDDLRARNANRDADVASFLSTASVLDISSDSSDSDSTTSSDSDGPSGPENSLGLSESALSLFRQRQHQHQRSNSGLFISDDSTGPDMDLTISSSSPESSTDSDLSPDSPSSDSELDTAAGSHRFFGGILSTRLPSCSSSSILSHSRVRSGLFLKSASSTPTAPKRRESTISRLFVTPGPAGTARTTPNQTPAPGLPFPAEEARHRRESTTSALFVSPNQTPAPGNRFPAEQARYRRESTTSALFPAS
ncbi:hypothetical protein F5144DRAFT_551576 [Chaetomium tenue]|uniref:Uncharacterized protein n=1 Tax=Chaetomium tenue TaxID=1854479 RepID=A0ACB7NUU0_9PEZI|nr:hypothetical protein F5144DRAFT_551576 [Chaetomium globosum]